MLQISYNNRAIMHHTCVPTDLLVSVLCWCNYSLMLYTIRAVLNILLNWMQYIKINLNGPGLWSNAFSDANVPNFVLFLHEERRKNSEHWNFVSLFFIFNNKAGTIRHKTEQNFFFKFRCFLTSFCLMQKIHQVTFTQIKVLHRSNTKDF